MGSSDLDRKRHEALELLRPACLSLMKDCTKENVKALSSSLTKVDDEVAQEIQQYILFPLQNSLNLKKLSESLLCDLCETLMILFNKTKVQMVPTFFDIFNPLVHALTSEDGVSGRVAHKSEDTKVAIVKAMTSLLKYSTEKVLTDFYSLRCLPAIGQLISLLVVLSETERSRNLQTLAMDCLLTILQTDSKYGKKADVHLGNMFAFCLPGVTMGMTRIITGDPKQGHSVLAKALSVWCRIVTLVMGDDSLKKATVQALPTQQKVDDSILQKLGSLAITRDETWVKATASKLKILIGQICKLRSHSNWRVRLSLAEMVEQVLMSCTKSLSESVSTLLEALVGLISDTYTKVSKKAQNALQVFSSSQAGTTGEKTLIEILEENLHGLATSLPRQIKMCDEEEKPALISLLNGYLSLLGSNISCVINSTPHLQRLSLALLQSLEMDISDIKIVEERGSLLHQEPEIFSDIGSVQIWRPRKYFKHFRDEKILSEFMLVCQQLGQYGNVYTLVDHFLDLYQESWMYKLAAVFIINEIVSGTGNTEKSEKLNDQRARDPQLVNDVISLLLDEYLSQENLRLVDSLSDNTSSSKSSSPSLQSSLVVVRQNETPETQKNITNRNRAVLLTCLLMEGVGKFATVLGKDFEVHLIRALYPLVENLGHESVHISSTAYTALVEVAIACGHRSLDSLIRNNADYLVSSVSLRLRHFDKNRRSPRTICVMLRYCSADLLPLVEHSITQLLDSLDENYTEDLVLFMPVLLELVTAVGRWFPPSKAQVNMPASKMQQTLTPKMDPQEIKAFILDYRKNKKLAEGNFTDQEVADCVDESSEAKNKRSLEEIESDMKKLWKERDEDKERTEEEKDVSDEDEGKKETPQHVQVVKKVFQRIRNLLSSHEPRLRVQALDVVSQGCYDLKDDEKELLPQVHQLWSGFYPLFQSEEKFIVGKAMKTLLVMSEVSGDFIKQRTMKDVVPVLMSYMEKQAKISSESRSAYLYTSHCKLQLCVLSTLGPITKNLQLDGNHLDTVAKICLPYLSDLQPVVLQKSAIEAFSSFISVDPDAMWLLLCQTYCPFKLELPGKAFVPVKFPFSMDKKNSFSTNIAELFKVFYT